MTTTSQLHWAHCAKCCEQTLHGAAGCIHCSQPQVRPAAPRPVEYQQRGVRLDQALSWSELAILDCLARGGDIADAARHIRTTVSAVRGARARIATKLGVALVVGNGCAPKNDKLIIEAARRRGDIAHPQTPPNSPSGEHLPASTEAPAFSAGT